MIRRQELIKVIEERTVQLQEYKDDPPSSEMIDRLSQDKKRLENQYEEVMKTLNFARRRVLLPKETEDPLYLDEQISKFEEQIERAKKELARLGEATGIEIPERLGFGRERPRSREELSVLLNQLVSIRELVTLVIESGVSTLSLLRPLPSPREGDEFTRVLKLEELRFELTMRAEISALTNLLYQLANHPYFFTVQDLEIKPVPGERREAVRDRREPGEQDRRRRRSTRQPGREEMPEKLPIESTELEARLIIATRLFPSPVIANSE